MGVDVPPPGLEVAESAGDTDVPRVTRCDRLERSEFDPLLGELFVPDPGDTANPGWTLITPAASPPLTGTRTACGG